MLNLQSLLPAGLPASAAWLVQRGYSSALLRKYVVSGWLVRPARGVYRRPGGKLQWQQAVISLQSLLGCQVVVGGRTALELQGHAHYLYPYEPRRIHLYAEEPVPAWLHQLNIGTDFICHNARRLFADPLSSCAADTISLPWGEQDQLIKFSRPHRAIFEMLDELPQNETFHQVDVIFESLLSLDPARVQQLLADCKSVKVKRLFLWFADRHQPEWNRRIAIGKAGLGKGKRVLVRGGRLDRKYQITVPKDMHE